MICQQKLNDIETQFSQTVALSDSVTVYDSIKVLDTVTVINTLALTDTLLIDLTIVGVDTDLSNTLKDFPNPSTGSLTIDNGDFGLMAQWRIVVIGSTGQGVFSSVINQKTFEIDLGDFGGEGLYFVQVYGADNKLIDVRKIVLK